VGLSESELGYRESLDPLRRRQTSWLPFERPATLLLGSDRVWRQVSIRQDAMVRNDRFALYLIVFLVVYVEMGLSLLDLNRKDFCLAEFAVFVSVCFATHSEIVYCGYGWIRSCGAIMRSSGPGSVRSIVGHPRYA
jgi:hypothetical protein